MYEAARWRDPELVYRLLRVLQRGQRCAQVGAPHVAAIDHAKRKHLAGGMALEERRELTRSAHQIEMEPVNRQVLETPRMLGNRLEIRRQQDLRAGLRERLIGVVQFVEPGFR